jgi:hypothetical protein
MNNRLLFFGCSFTNVENSQTGIQFENYRFKLANTTGLNQISNAESGKSNQHIIDDIYTCSNKTIYLNDIFVIQYTFFDRLGLRADMYDNRFVSVCKSNIDDNCDWKEIEFINYYNSWLKYFYSKKGSITEFEKEVNLISNWLRISKIKFISIGFDENMDTFSKYFYESNNFVKFDETYSMYNKATNKKLRISDINPSESNRDNHLNEEGHSYLSDKIIYKLKELDYIR